MIFSLFLWFRSDVKSERSKIYPSRTQDDFLTACTELACGEFIKLPKHSPDESMALPGRRSRKTKTLKISEFLLTDF